MKIFNNFPTTALELILVNKNDFLEIYCAANLDVCETRDTKGLYAKARAGEIKEFTGISSPYEEPNSPELTINTGLDKLDECYMKEHNKSIFEIRDFKWFDPANGIGNFLIAVYIS